MMHHASIANLDTRRAGIGIVYVGNYNPNGQPPIHRVPDGCTATLKSIQSTILIKSVRHTATGTFIEEIYGFEPDALPGQTGMQVEDSIEFHESHIFGVQV
jgi:ribosomal protein S16